MKRRTLLGSVTALGLLAATPSFAWPVGEWQLILSTVWNGPASTVVGTYYDKPACEAAFTAYQADALAVLQKARPDLWRQGYRPAVIHTCAKMYTP